ncbi:MAG: hypothetical protein EA385_10285 [Salinarimonadaceae bacterium]|nr:MAG: hypothetical protein EA385_10285 [Salinarimonadaceae bacterium]
MVFDAHTVASLQTIVVGFVFSGLLASAFEYATQRRASFSLLQEGGVLAVLSVPMLVFCAPFIILRNTIRGRRFERRPVGFVMIATVIAGLWSLLSGTVLRDGVNLLIGA